MSLDTNVPDGLKINWIILKDANTDKILWRSLDDLLKPNVVHEMRVSKKVLQCHAISREVNFSSVEAIENLRMEQRAFFKKRCIEEWTFNFGRVSPKSTNTWKSVFMATPEADMMPTKILNGNVIIETKFFNADVLIGTSNLKEKKIEVQKLKGQLQLEKERGKLMNSHYGDLNQEMNYVQQVCSAQRHELEIEDHSRRLLDRERSRLTQEIQSLTKEIDALKLRQESQEVKISNQSEKCKSLKVAIQCEEEALLKWLRESADVEKDKIALTKYTHQDNAAIKELNLMLERLAKEAKDRKTALDDADTDVFIAQSELDRLQSEFRETHNERKNIISNWEKVLHQLQKRNQEINDLSNLMDSMREEEKIFNQKLKEQQILLSAQVANNKELEHRIANEENYAAKLRLNAMEEEKCENDLRAEVETLKNISHYLTYQAQSMRNELKHLEEQIEKQTDRLESVEKSEIKLQEQIQTLTKEAFDADHYTRQLDLLLLGEKNELSKTQSWFRVLENAVLKINHSLQDLQTEEKARGIKVEGSQTTSRSLSQCIMKLDNDRLQQRTMMYRINLCVENLENRIRLMEGELTNDEERREMELRKSKLQADLSEKNSSLDFITQQIRYLKEKMTRALKTLSISKQQHADVTDRIAFLDFYIANSNKSLKRANEKKEDLMVDNCLVNLQLTKYRELLRQKNETVLDLQRTQVELETIIKERIYEIRTCCDMIQTEIHKEQEECYQTKRQLQECSDKVTKSQTRYEVMLNALGIPDSEEIHADLLIKAEDEKRGLQQQRNELLSAVLKRDDELQALRNTVWLIQNCIEQFRRSLNPPGMSQEDYEKMCMLEEEQQQVDIGTHDASQRQQDLLSEISESLLLSKENEKKLSHINNMFWDKKAINESIVQEINELEIKLQRADKSNSKITLDALEKSDNSIIDDDIRIHQLRDLRKTAIDILFAGVTEDQMAYDKVKTVFEEVNLPIPSRTRSSVFGRSPSSSLSSLFGKSQAGRSATPSGSEQSLKLQRNVITPSIISLGTDLSDDRTATPNSSLSSKGRNSKRK